MKKAGFGLWLLSFSHLPAAEDSPELARQKIHGHPTQISSRQSLPNHETRLQDKAAEFAAQDKRIMQEVWWKADPTQPITRLEVCLSSQKIYAYQGEKNIAISPVSTARPGYVTPTGNFIISDMKAVYCSNLYGEFINEKGAIVNYNAELGDEPPPGARYVPSPMPNFMRLSDDGIGLHAGFLPGYPASHGCVRLPAEVARNIFDLVRIGTPVSVIP